MTDEMRRDGPSRLRGRPRPPLNAYRMYLVLSAGTAFLLSCIFSVNLVYHATVVALEPLQLVLVGTILEGTVFLFEIPTGIVADLKSRRLSIVIGYVLMGAGFILEGAVRISREVGGMGEEALAVLRTGDAFGEMALIDATPRSADAKAHERCRLLVVTRDALEEVLFLRKDLAYEVLWNFVKILTARLRETNDKMAFLSASGRF